MNEEEYLKSRLVDQINWFDKKSQINQKQFKRLRLVEIVSAAIIPFLSGMGDKVPYSAWIIGALGVMIALSAAFIALFKYQENWIAYRTTSEQLNHHHFMFLAGAQPYHTEDRFQLLVEHVEGILSKENSSWAVMSAQQSKGAKNK